MFACLCLLYYEIKVGSYPVCVCGHSELPSPTQYFNKTDYHRECILLNQAVTDRLSSLILKNEQQIFVYHSAQQDYLYRRLSQKKRTILLEIWDIIKI